MGGKINMKKIIGIFICMILFFTTIPVIESSSSEDSNYKSGQKYFAIIHVRGRIKNLKEEYYNGTLWYNCSIVNMIYLQLIIRINPFEVSYYRDRLKDFNLPLYLPKDTFVGIIKENFVLGTAYFYGDW